MTLKGRITAALMTGLIGLGGSGAAFAGGDDPLMAWAVGASEAIDKVMVYPQSAVRRNKEATLTYRVTVDDAGEVTAYSLTNVKGSRYLTGAGRRTIEKADFPALSDAMDRDELTFAVRLNFVVAPSTQELEQLDKQPRVTTRRIASKRGPLTASITILEDE